MNTQKFELMNLILDNDYTNQRALANACGYSLGVVNQSIKELILDGYLDSNMAVTEKSEDLLEMHRPKRAIILAAGSGTRMAPINLDTPKALVEVNGEALIERLIKQLHEVGITEIYVIVGFMKEAFDYLIDEYGVELIVNMEYASKNNLYSLKRALPHLSDCYVLPSDIWCSVNPFRKHEFYSWYMVTDKANDTSVVRVNRKMELVNSDGGNTMIGISYLTQADGIRVQKKITALCKDGQNDNAFWEAALIVKDRYFIPARVVRDEDASEINTYEQLRSKDHQSKHLESEAIQTAAEVLQVKCEEIVDITVLKKGMTNRSFSFVCKGKKYIMRIPGEGTDQLINRKEEADVYHVLQGKGISDTVIYLNPENGYKITEFLNDARVCDPFNPEDVQICMNRLKTFHQLNLKVNHRFDLFKHIDFYESLWEGAPSMYRDYKKTKAQVVSLKAYIDAHTKEERLTHIDAVPDNFLFTKRQDGKEDVRLIDWEYAGMQDPHVDLAMFCIYALYDREQVDALIDAYFTEGCPKETRIKIYCYIAVCGLLWSNWCEYKSKLGVEFGEYSLKQYRFAKDYYKIVQEELKKGDCKQ